MWQTENRFCQKQTDLSNVWHPCTSWPRTSVKTHVFFSVAPVCVRCNKNVVRSQNILWDREQYIFVAHKIHPKANSKNLNIFLKVQNLLWKCILSTQKLTDMTPPSHTNTGYFVLKSSKGKAELYYNRLCNNYSIDLLNMSLRGLHNLCLGTSLVAKKGQWRSYTFLDAPYSHELSHSYRCTYFTTSKSVRSEGHDNPFYKEV